MRAVVGMAVVGMAVVEMAVEGRVRVVCGRVVCGRVLPRSHYNPCPSHNAYIVSRCRRRHNHRRMDICKCSSSQWPWGRGNALQNTKGPHRAKTLA